MTQQPSLVDNAGDPEQVKRAELFDRRRLAIDDEDLRFVLKTTSGRRVIQNILDVCLIEVNSLDPLANTYASGRRCPGTSLKLAIEEACPDLYLIMEQERLAHTRKVSIAAAKEKLEEEGDPNGI